MAKFDFSGKRIVVTHANECMGPKLLEVFEEDAATVVADEPDLREGAAVSALGERAGHIDILVANLGVPAPSTRITDSNEEEWRHVFTHMVDPLP